MYLLDADTIIYSLKGNKSVIQKLEHHQTESQAEVK